jgi:hypothetical protein
MAKRTRGSPRPGQRRPVQRSVARPSSAVSGTPEAAALPRPPGSLTREEEARAAELEAQIRAEERASDDAQRRARDRSRTADVAGPRARELEPLAVRAATEYAYVRRDMVRIAMVGAIVFGVLLLLYVVIDVLGLIRV